MKNKNEVGIDIQVVSLVSNAHGDIDVMVICTQLGQVLCKVQLAGEGCLTTSIWHIENEAFLECVTRKGLEDFVRGLSLQCILSVKDCLKNPSNWVVAENEPDFDVLMFKQDLEPQFLKSLGNRPQNFPLFKGIEIIFSE